MQVRIRAVGEKEKGVKEKGVIKEKGVRLTYGSPPN